MKPTTSAYNSEIAASCRSLRSQVVCNGTTYTSSNYIKKIDIEATPIDGKHFGFSVSQKCVVTFLENSGTFTVGSTFVPSIGTSSLLIDYQPFYIDTVDVDKKSGDITVTGYDAISLLNKYTYGDLNYSSGTTKTLSQILTDIASKIGLSVTVTGGANLSRSYSYNNINATSDTTLRAILDALCEVTGTYAYMGLSNLCVRQLPSASVLNINKNVSFEQTISDVSTLSGIAAVNALETTITVGTTNNYVQVINDNAFLSLLTDAEITTILTAVKAVVPTNIYSYDITWAANPALEYGDMVNIYTDDTHYTTTYYLGEILSYDGGLKTSSTWSKTDSPAIDANASTTVSSSIKRAEAKVDKVNAEIDLKVSKDEIISSINLTPEAIKISSEKINLNGYVTFTDLSTATNPPTTVINGNNITTGTISADRIDTAHLESKYIKVTDANNKTIFMTDGRTDSSTYRQTKIGPLNVTSKGLNFASANASGFKVQMNNLDTIANIDFAMYTYDPTGQGIFLTANPTSTDRADINEFNLNNCKLSYDTKIYTDVTQEQSEDLLGWLEYHDSSIEDLSSSIAGRIKAPVLILENDELKITGSLNEDTYDENGLAPFNISATHNITSWNIENSDFSLFKKLRVYWYRQDGVNDNCVSWFDIDLRKAISATSAGTVYTHFFGSDFKPLWANRNRIQAIQCAVSQDRTKFSFFQSYSMYGTAATNVNTPRVYKIEGWYN